MAKLYGNLKFEKKCIICIHSTQSLLSEELLCKKRGFVAADHCCIFYKYDPLKRVPEKTAPLPNVNPEDLKL